MDLMGRVEALSDAACEVWDAVVAGGWSPMAVTDTLGAIDVLVAALARLGPDAEQALAPVLAATSRIRTIATQEDSKDRHSPSRASGRGPGSCPGRPAQTGRVTRRCSAPSRLPPHHPVASLSCGR